MAESLRARFKPRYRGLAWSAIGIGGALTALALPLFVSPFLPLVSGAAGIVLGGGYLISPTWRLELVIDDDGYEVRTPTRTKFRVTWRDVKRVVVSKSTSSCLIDAGEPARNLLVPGVGAPAPYDLEDRPALVAAILAHVDPKQVKEVERLDLLRS